MGELERISLAIDRDLLGRFDALVDRAGHANPSEAVRDLVRARLVEEEWRVPDGDEAVATVTLVYDHGKRELADRLVEVGHDNHHATVASLHVHLDHDRCLEVIVLRGAPAEIRDLANHLIGMKGVEHGKVVLSSAAPGANA